jgi:hypothetical protein
VKHLSPLFWNTTKAEKLPVSSAHCASVPGSRPRFAETLPTRTILMIGKVFARWQKAS